MDFNTNSPIYLQIANAVKRKILSGEWKLGDKVPPVRELALEMGVNPNTAQRAVASLESEGLLYTERTSGRYVTTNKSIVEQVRRKLTDSEIEGFMESMRGIGYKDGEILALFTRYTGQKYEGSGTHEEHTHGK